MRIGWALIAGACCVLVSCGDDAPADALDGRPAVDTGMSVPENPSTCKACSSPDDCDHGEQCAPNTHGQMLCMRPCANGCPDGFTCTVRGSVDLCVPDEACCFDQDGDGYGLGDDCALLDCRDSARDIFPGAVESCNGADDDCDGVVDEQPTACQLGDCRVKDDGTYESVSGASCQANGVCGGDGETTSCGRYACNGRACARSCGGEIGCAEGFVCVDGDCMPPCTRVGEVCSLGAGSCELGRYTCVEGEDVCEPSGEALAAGTTCRPSAGVCDPEEFCDGTSLVCPTDHLDSTTVCAPAEGACDLAETCDGEHPGCPSNRLKSEGTVCRADMGECDLEDVCDGVSTACANRREPNGTDCSTGVCESGSCDGSCTRSGDACSLPGRPCERAEYRCVNGEDVCTGLGTGANGGTVCRESAGACDVAETCDGTSPNCPSNGFLSSSTVCRSSAGACDLQERCTGSSAACPSNSFRPTSYVCRAGGSCTLDAHCAGGASCPSSPHRDNGTTCGLPTCLYGLCDPGAACIGSAETICDTPVCMGGTCSGISTTTTDDTCYAPEGSICHPCLTEPFGQHLKRPPCQCNGFGLCEPL